MIPDRQPFTGLTDLQTVGLVLFLVAAGFLLAYLILGADHREHDTEVRDEPQPVVFGPTTIVMPSPVERIPDQLIGYEPGPVDALFPAGVETDVQQALAIGNDSWSWLGSSR